MPTETLARAETIDIPHELVLMHERGYARELPPFLEQCADPNRDTKYYWEVTEGDSSNINSPYEVTDSETEHQGLQNLKKSLEQEAALHGGQLAADIPLTIGLFLRNPAARATAFLRNFNWVGQDEADIAAQILAADWKSYLDADPKNQLCILANKLRLSDSDGWASDYDESYIKSDRYLLEKALEHFDTEELRHYAATGRLCLDPGQLTADIEHLEIRGIDDRVISGEQIQGVRDFIEDKFPQYRDKLSIQLILATKKQLKNGVRGMPVRSVYLAKDALDDGGEIRLSVGKDNTALSSSLHSRSDYSFWHMLPKSCKNVHLAGVIPPYKREGHVVELPLTKMIKELLSQPPQSQQTHKTGLSLGHLLGKLRSKGKK